MPNLPIVRAMLCDDLRALRCLGMTACEKRLGGDDVRAILGQRFFFATTGQGSCHCERCGGDRAYRQLAGRRWLTLLLVPVMPLGKAPDHLQCTVCGTRYRLDLLGLPTVAQMQAALPAGTQAAAVAMLRAGDPRSASARHRAVEVIRGAGLTGYDDAALEAELARAGRSAQEVSGLLNGLATQLVDQARWWFLADVVRIGLAGGPLTQRQRTAALQIGAQLGIGPARARDVITLTEQGAPSE